MSTRTIATLAFAILVLISCRTSSGQSTGEGRALGSATGSSAASSQESSVVHRRVWVGSTNVDSRYLSPSPDGRLVTFVDWSTGDLAVRDLVTGETRRLTDTGGWSQSNEYATRSAFSPDGRQIAYAWSTADSGYQLRLIDVDGSHPRLLYERDGELSFLDPHAWSPDGEQVFTSLVTSAGPQLALISVEDGSYRVLRGNPRSVAFKAGFSPDGRYVAYDQPTEERGGRDDVVVVAVETGREVRLTSGPGYNEYLGWAPDGSRVYFYSDGSGSPSIWAVPVSEGEASGAPELIKQDVQNLQPIGVGGGKLFYLILVENPGVHTMALDIPSGRVLTGATAEVGPSKGIASAFPAWSSDGRYLAYVHVPEETPVWKPNLIIRSVSGNNLRQLPIPDGWPGWIGWAPDSEGIVVSGGERTLLLSLATGRADILLERAVSRAALSSDGKTLYAPVDLWAVASYDIETGSETVLHEQDPPQRGMEVMDLSLAPDGQTLAIGFSRGIALMPVSGGELRWVYRGEPSTVRHRGGLPWTPDGRTILFVQSGGLWAVPVSGGEPRKLFSMPSLQHVRLHPDGRRLAFRGGPTRAELWVMENAPGFPPR